MSVDLVRRLKIEWYNSYQQLIITQQTEIIRSTKCFYLGRRSGGSLGRVFSQSRCVRRRTEWGDREKQENEQRFSSTTSMATNWR